MAYIDGKIYVIRNPEVDGCYIGSTTKSLGVRFSKHRNNHKRWKAGTYNYVSSFKLFETGTPTIELLQNYPCETRKQLETQEGKHIMSVYGCVNQNVAGRRPI